MTPFTQPAITGYRQLTDAEAAVMNNIKLRACEIGALVEQLQNLALHPDIDQRWVAIGATDLQKGFMALTRAVARPTTF